MQIPPRRSFRHALTEGVFVCPTQFRARRGRLIGWPGRFPAITRRRHEEVFYRSFGATLAIEVTPELFDRATLQPPLLAPRAYPGLGTDMNQFHLMAAYRFAAGAVRSQREFDPNPCA